MSFHADEINKFIMNDNIFEVFNNNIDRIKFLIPEINQMIGFKQNNPYHIYDVWKHTLYSILYSKKDIICRITMLFHDISKPICYTEDETGCGHFKAHAYKSANMSVDILKRLGYNDNIIEKVYNLIFYHDVDLKPKIRQLKRLYYKLGEQDLKMLLEVKKADIKAQNPVYLNRLNSINSIYNCLENIIKKEKMFGIKDMAIGGRDLINIGIYNENIGKVLKILLEMVLNKELENNRNLLLSEAYSIFKRL